MGLRDWLLAPAFPERKAERFSSSLGSASIGDPAFAAWLLGTDDSDELVTPATVMGLSAMIRALQILAVIATLPLKSYEKQGDDRVRIVSDFDDPYPGPDGLTPFAWTETLVYHLVLWRHAFLWHEPRNDGGLVSYRPVVPDTVKVRWEAGKRVFKFRDPETNEEKTVGSESITYIPGPSLNGFSGHPILYAARAVFSAAISGDKTAQRMLKKGIRLGGIVSPADPSSNDEPGATDIDEEEMKAILASLRATALGSENAGDIVGLNRRIKLQPWSANNIEAQFDETRSRVLMQIEQLTGVPPYLMADVEKQTSWGTGVAEQNYSLARFTLMGWSSRIEQVLSRRLPRAQFCEYDYLGLLQGTPADAVDLVIQQLDAGLISLDYACKVLNLPAPTAEQREQRLLPRAPSITSLPRRAAA